MREEDPLHWRWHYYYCLVSFGGILILLITGGLLGVVRSGHFAHTVLSILALGEMIAIAALFPVTGIVTFFKYYSDSKFLRESDEEWRPIWWLYMISHTLFGPFAALFYLSKRNAKVGNDYSKTLTGRVR